MDEEFELFEDKEAYRYAKQLSELIKNSDEYIYYRKCLEELKKEPELYCQVNELRRLNYEFQNCNRYRMSYEQYAEIHSRMTNLRKTPIVSKFFNSEIAISRLVRNVYKQIIEGIEFDIDFLN